MSQQHDEIQKLVNETLERINYLTDKAWGVKESTIKQMEKELDHLQMQKEAIEKALKNYDNAEEGEKAKALERLEAELDWSVIEKIRYTFYQWSDKLSAFPEWADQTFSAIVDDASGKIGELEKQIGELEKKAEQTSGEVKEKILLEIEQLQERKRKMEQRVHDFSEKSGKAWESFSSGIKEAGSVLHKAFQEAYKNF